MNHLNQFTHQLQIYDFITIKTSKESYFLPITILSSLSYEIINYIIFCIKIALLNSCHSLLKACEYVTIHSASYLLLLIGFGLFSPY